MVGVSVAVALIDRRGEPERFLPGTAEAAVQDYLAAIEDSRDRDAFDFVGPQVPDGCDYQHFRDSLRRFRPDGVRQARELRITLVDVEEVDQTVEVRVRVTRFSGDPPFGANEYSRAERFVLEEHDGSWRFTEAPWPMDWCPEPPHTPTAPPATPAP